MEMTYSEICASYRQAKNRNHQIGVLADLNDCSRAEIREILEECGEIKANPKAAYNAELIEKERMLRIQLGLSMREAAKIAGIGHGTLWAFEASSPSSARTIKGIKKAVKTMEKMIADQKVVDKSDERW